MSGGSLPSALPRRIGVNSRIWLALLTASLIWARTAAARLNSSGSPYGDYNCLILPEDAEEKERDYVMLSDIFPTGWHSTRLANLTPGDSVVIYGSGPVGLMAALSARVQGASRIFVVDHNTDRLKVAENIGCHAYRGR